MANALQEHYGEWVLDRIRAQRYPNVTYMNMLEEIGSPRLMAEYTLHLFERIEADTYPSIPMMQRLQGLVARWGPELGLDDDDDEDREKQTQKSRPVDGAREPGRLPRRSVDGRFAAGRPRMLSALVREQGSRVEPCDDRARGLSAPR